MGRRNFLVEGGSGTGKSSVADELERRGQHAVHGDRVLAYHGDPATGAVLDPHVGPPSALRTHDHHLWWPDRVRDIVDDHTSPVTFLCGGSRNWASFVDLLDGVFVLEVDLPTLHRRIATRAADEWGGRPDELALILQRHETGQDLPPGVRIDAGRPLADVVDEILRRVADVGPPRARC